MSHHRKTVNLSGGAKAGPYSHAVVSNGLVFISGQTPLDPSTGKLLEGSIGDMTRQCLENLATVASEAGTDLAADAVRMAIYLTDLSRFQEVNEAYGAFFASDPPARTTIGVAALPLGAEIEIDAVVALPD